MEQSQLVSENSQNKKVFLDLSILDNEVNHPQFDCLIILNSYFADWMLEFMVDKAKSIIATDGGANLLYKYSMNIRETNKLQAIIGDFDSCQTGIKEYYNKRKVKILKMEDQDTNDFEKSIIYARERNFKTIVCLGVLGGRIDQEICNLNNIERYSK